MKQEVTQQFGRAFRALCFVQKAARAEMCWTNRYAQAEILRDVGGGKKKNPQQRGICFPTVRNNTMFSGFLLHLLLQWLRTSVTTLLTIPRTQPGRSGWWEAARWVDECVHASDIIAVKSSRKSCPCSFVSLKSFGNGVLHFETLPEFIWRKFALEKAPLNTGQTFTSDLFAAGWS